MVGQNEMFIDEARKILFLHEELLAIGLKSKDIAKVLNLYPSAYSSLINKVLKEISKLENTDVDMALKISNRFLAK